MQNNYINAKPILSIRREHLLEQISQQQSKIDFFEGENTNQDSAIALEQHRIIYADLVSKLNQLDEAFPHLV